MMSRNLSLRNLALCSTLACTPSLQAELNVRIIGPRAIGIEQIGHELRFLLENATPGTVRVVTEDLERSRQTVLGMQGRANNLFTWFFWPFPDPGEADTDWDWIILAEDPATLLHLPGFHAAGVAAIQKETARGSARLMLLMPPPGGSATDTARIRAVVSRIGRSAGIPVASTAYTLFKCITGEQDLSASTPDNNPTHEDFPKGPFALLGDKRSSLFFSHKGTSTERDLTAAIHAALRTLSIQGDSERFTGKYNSETPQDDGLGWPEDASLPIAFNLGRHPDFVDDGHKSYVTNPDVWQLAFAFAYQHFTSEYSVEEANAHFLAMIAPLDLAVALRIKDEPTARAVPLRALWALIHQEYPEERYQRDRVHLNCGLLKAAGVFIVTLYTGGTPVEEISTDPAFAGKEDYDLFCQRVGHELAWQLSHLQIRKK